MSRELLLGAVSVAALSLSSAAMADNIVGGGASLVAADVGNNGLNVVTTANTEFGTYDATPPVNSFVFQKSSSGAGRNAVLQNDETCNVANIAYAAGLACETVAFPNAIPGVFYGLSDAALSSSEIAYAATKSAPAVNTVYGNLIQIPFLGTGLAIPVYAPGVVTANGQVTLKDADLCGIFSGSITNWSQTSAAAVLGNNPITVAYRSDSAGASFLLTNHLASADGTVCTSANTAAGVTLAPTSYFATQFPTAPSGIFTKASVVNGVTYYTPANFFPVVGNSAEQAYLLANPYGAGYVSPDVTAITTIGNQTLFVAGISRDSGKPSYITPTTANISAALNSVVPSSKNPANINTKPPTATTANDPTKWIPNTQDSTKGYPIVGYTNIVLTQCDSPASIGTSLSDFLNLHYTNATYQAIQATNGLVSLTTSKATTKFVTAIQKYITLQTAKTGIQSTKGCTGYAGRSTTSK